MDKFKRTYTLVQHTPLLHFQQNQPGATLRATEVKPKLDRFLWRRLSEKQRKKWRSTEERNALRYQLHIAILEQGSAASRAYLIPPKKDEIKGKEYPMFFANMGDDYEKGDRVALFGDTLQVSVRAFQTDLLDFIDEQIADFFAATTFGMRSTKGYGSFTVKGKTSTIRPRFSFEVPGKDWRTAMQYVDLFYKSVRGGINGAPVPVAAGLVNRKDKPRNFIPGFYMKPLIFIYANDNGVKWEKRVIKQKAGPKFKHKKADEGRQELYSEWIPPSHDVADWPLWQEKANEAIVRDLLGLSSEQKWMGYPADKVEKKSVSQNIDRFPSPWIFKPSKYSEDEFKVDVFVKDIPDEYLGSQFFVEVGNEKLWADSNKTEYLQLPVWENFDMNQFISEYLTVEMVDSAISHDDIDEDLAAVENILFDIYETIQHYA